MPERRYRPGDVLDDYCPRERRITDHAIVAMIDDEIRRTRCGICDAEHEYKEGKVPTPRRKTQPPGLFNQVLDNINGTPKPQPPHSVEPVVEPQIEEPVSTESLSTEEAPAAVTVAAEHEPAVSAAATETASAPAEPEESEDDNIGNQQTREEGGFRRSLIRATFPRPDGQPQQPQRNTPEFTIQALHNRRNNNQRHAGGHNKFRGGRRRPGGGNPLDNIGPMRFRDHGQGQDRPQGQGHGGRRRRGGKKNR
jgi:hypothetical protein